RVFEDASIVDEDIDRARGAGELVDETPVVEVAGDGLHHVAALPPERVELRLAATGRQDPGAGLREGNGGCPAAAATRTGDKRGLPGQRHARFAPQSLELYITR